MNVGIQNTLKKLLRIWICLENPFDKSLYYNDNKCMILFIT